MTSPCSPKGSVMQCRYLIIEQNSMTIARKKSRHIILSSCKPFCSRQDVLAVPCFKRYVPVYKVCSCNLYTSIHFSGFIPLENSVTENLNSQLELYLCFFLSVIPELKVMVSLVEASFLTQG